MNMAEIREVQTDDAPAAIGPYSQAVSADGWLFTAGQIGIDPSTGELAGSDAASQARQLFQNLRAVLAAAGLDFERVVRATVYLADMDDFESVNGVYAEAFSRPFPARSTVQVGRLPRDARVEVDLVAKAAGL